MRMAIQRGNGVRAEALLLAVSKSRMRVVIAGTADTVELSMMDGRWIDESGEIIEFEALLPLDGIGWPGLCADLYPRTAVAGGGLYN